MTGQAGADDQNEVTLAMREAGADVIMSLREAECDSYFIAQEVYKTMRRIEHSPRHRLKQKSFVTLVSELRVLCNDPGVPLDLIHVALRLLDSSGKCVVIHGQRDAAAAAREASNAFQPSDLFSRFVAAFRARDWPLVRVIEHEAFSL